MKNKILSAIKLLCVVVITACSSTPEEQAIDQSVPGSSLNLATGPTNVNQFDNFSENFNNNDFFNNEFNNNSNLANDDGEFQDDDFFEDQFQNEGQFDNNFGENINNEMEENFAAAEGQDNSLEFGQENFNNQAFFEDEPFQNDADFTFEGGQQQVAPLPSENIFASQAQVEFDSGGNVLTQQQFAQNGQLNLDDPLANTPLPPVVQPAPALLASDPAAVSPDIEAVSFELHWVGMRYLQAKRKLKLQIDTKGTPQFEVFQEQNQSDQPELVLRFYQTRRRAKLKWDMDASEFRSPLAHVRTRELADLGITDVVLTLREAARPKFFSVGSNITLTFDIPDHYFGKIAVLGEAVAKASAVEVVGNSRIGLILAQNSERPLMQQEESASSPVDGDTEIEEVMADPINIDESGLPDNFSQHRSVEWSQYFVVEQHFSALFVGQDNGEDNFNINIDEQGEFSDQNDDLEFLENSQQPDDFLEGQNNQFTNNGEFQQNDNFFGQEQFQNDLNFGNGNFQNQENLFQNQGQQQFGQENFGFQEQQNGGDFNQQGEFVEQGIDDFQNQNQDLFGQQEQVGTDLIGQESTDVSLTQKSKYKVIFMEFTDAPLSIVFKSFSAETGNNFIYPKSVGELTISIHFQGVPWDEALRAILETHSLGMVRVGDNIVRVDAVERLTDYLQALERAQQFEARRSPTKILVFRLNNAKAAEVAERITTLLIRDRQIDPRIQVSFDERTNSIVIEAAEHIIAKAKNIIDRLDLKTPQVEIATRIVEVRKTNRNLFGISWLNQALLNFDPGRGLGFGSLNFPNSLASSFAVDPGIRGTPSIGNAQFRFGSINRFLDLDLLLRMEETKGTTNVLQSNRVLVLDGREALILSGSSRFFRPAAGGVNVGGAVGAAGGGGEQGSGLSEVKFNLSLEVKPQVTADGAVIMDLSIKSDTPSPTTGEVLADKSTRELTTQMVRDSGDTGVIGGIYDTSKTESVVGIPYLSAIPIIGALFRATTVDEDQTELLIMVTPTIMSGNQDAGKRQDDFALPQRQLPKKAAKG